MTTEITSIDVYRFSDDENVANQKKADQIMYGKLISNIQVLAVKDSSGQPVFQNLDEKRVPAMVVFALPEEYHILLRKAALMRTYDTSVELVPTNESLKDEPGDVTISSDDLKEWNNNHTYWTENN